MKWKYIFLLTVLLILISGCAKSNEKQKDVSHKDKVESVEKKEKQSEDAKEQETVETDGSKETEPIQTENHISSEATTQEDTKNQEQTVISQPQGPAGEATEPTEPTNNAVPSTPAQPPQNPVVSYSPQSVVDLATSKTKAYGKILLTENLDRLLAEGMITREEYNAYYPYDGAGYYSIFVETNLSEAKTTSGRLLGSVDGIAQYIADTLSLEPGPYFLIEYAGIYSSNGTDFYEFRCYRA